jgi:BMFP domain-containing protein YqiC
LDSSNLTLTSVKAKNDALEARIAALEGAQA